VAVIDAALFLPQSRERVFVVAVDSSIAIPAALTSPTPGLPFHPPPLLKALHRQKTAPIWWRLPLPPARNTALVDLIEDKPSGPFPPKGLWHPQAETDRLIAMMTPIHLAKLEEAKRTSIANRMRIVGGFSKHMRDEAAGRVQRVEVRFDGVAKCLRRGSGGGSSVQSIMIVDGALVRSRRLSAREAARLMGLSDDYQLPSDYGEAYDLIGDGLAVPVVRFLAEHIIEPVLQACRQDAL
jgi:DNA (cytosine-5)-methyltransferase 1